MKVRDVQHVNLAAWNVQGLKRVDDVRWTVHKQVTVQKSRVMRQPVVHSAAISDDFQFQAAWRRIRCDQMTVVHSSPFQPTKSISSSQLQPAATLPAPSPDYRLT